MLRITQNLLLLAVLAFPGLSEPPIVHAQSASSGSISGQSQPSSVKSRVPTRTIIRYGSGFFADKSPKTALDMVNLLPGFTFSLGDTSIRGYAAAAGNVLIDGERPSEK